MLNHLTGDQFCNKLVSYLYKPHKKFAMSLSEFESMALPTLLAGKFELWELALTARALLSNPQEPLSIKRDLDLEGTVISSLPEGLRVGGNLFLNKKITVLPNNITVGGNMLFGAFSKIKALPEGLYIKGNIDLRESQIKTLPEDLKVDGELIMVSLIIESLPENFQINGSISLDYADIKSLPDGLTVNGWLSLYHTKIESLPKRLKVGEFLDIRGTDINWFPIDLAVKGEIFYRKGFYHRSLNG